MPGRLWRLELDHRVEEGAQWKLVVNFRSDKATAALLDAGLPGTRAIDLTPSELTEVQTLTERSRLDEGGHIGVGGTGMAASLETLTLQNLEDGRTVVLVTIGNRNFVDDPARRSLLQRLRALQVRLLSGSVR